MKPYYHARSSAKKWGGTWEDYIQVHEFMDLTKFCLADVRHRAILHNSFGVYLATEVFGSVLKISLPDGKIKEVPVAELAEQHILEDLGRIPSIQDWLEKLPIELWMAGAVSKTRHAFHITQADAEELNNRNDMKPAEGKAMPTLSKEEVEQLLSL
jgi:hypothetical protein